MKIVDTARSRLRRDSLLRRCVKFAARPLLAWFDFIMNRRYNKWLFISHMPTGDALSTQRKHEESIDYRPLVSIVVPVYNPPKMYFMEMIESVVKQTYSNWELILIDDASPDDVARRAIKEYAEKDDRIRYKFLKNNKHISGATNEGVRMSRGEFVSLLDNDDILHPSALYEVILSLNDHSSLDFIYTDEDKIGDSFQWHTSPYFKPDLNIDFLYSVNYITHFSTIRRRTLIELGLLDGEYNGAQDWELFLRVIRKVDPSKIYHIPKILYSWRVHEASTAGKIETAKPYVIEAQRRALMSELEERGGVDYKLRQDTLYPAQWVVEFALTGLPQVALVPLGDIGDIDGLVNSYKNVITPDVSEGIEQAIRSVKSGYIMFACERIGRWNMQLIEKLLADAQRKDIGFVSARYVDNDEVIDNIRQLINPEAMELVSNMNERDITKHFYLTTRYNVPQLFQRSCLMVRVDLVHQALKSGVSADIEALSRYLSDLGYRNLYNPYVCIDQ